MIRADHIVRAVRKATLEPLPFPHLRLAAVFPEPVYRDLLRLLPPGDRYVELRHKDAIRPDGSASRLQFPLTDDNLGRLDPARRRLWRLCASALGDPGVGAALAARFEASVPGLGSTPLAGATLQLSLLRDLPGYRIRAHQDDPSKLFTAQVYLPPDCCGAALSTHLFRRDDNGVLRGAGTIPYVPNTGYAFAVSDDSWHGVDPIPAGTPPRNSLMLIWYRREFVRPAVKRGVRRVRSKVKLDRPG